MKNLILFTLFLLTSLTSLAQLNNCGGTLSCPNVVLPFGQGMAHTEVAPNKLNLNNTCYDPSGQILGAVLEEDCGNSSLIMFTTAPAIDVLAGGVYQSWPILGNYIMFAGVDCKVKNNAHLSAAIAITNTHINALRGGDTISWALPSGNLPTAVACISECSQNYLDLSICVETNQNYIVVISPAGVQTNFLIPAPLVANSVSWNTGQDAGVVAFTLNTVYLISAGNMTPIPLPGNFINYVIVPGTGITVNTTSGPFLIPFLPNAIFLPFGVANVPMPNWCANFLDNNIAFNIAPCFPNIDAVNAGWVTPLSCAQELNVPYLNEHKDTKMLCLSDVGATRRGGGGALVVRPGCCEFLQIGPNGGPWDDAHPPNHAITGCEHCLSYSGEACIAMINHYYNGTLTQDEIAFMGSTLDNASAFDRNTLGAFHPLSKGPEYVSWRTAGNHTDPTPDGPNPEQDLSHGDELWQNELENALYWALNLNANVNPQDSINNVLGPPDANVIVNEICHKRPILIEDNNIGLNTAGHRMLIIGYKILPAFPFFMVKVWDPLPGGFLGWYNYPGNLPVGAPINKYWLIPNVNYAPSPQFPNGRGRGSANVTSDEDEDGLITFDENNRFLTKPTSGAGLLNGKDTDHDEVFDKQEIRRYTFHGNGVACEDQEHVNNDWCVVYWDNAVPGCAGCAAVNKDVNPITGIPGGKMRPERDCDSDGDGTFDGGEDRNGTGKLDGPEVASDDDPLDVCGPLITIKTDKEKYFPWNPVFLILNRFHANSTYTIYRKGNCPPPPKFLNGPYIGAPNNAAIFAQKPTVTTDNDGNFNQNIGPLPVGCYYIAADVMHDEKFRGQFPAFDNIDPEWHFEVIDFDIPIWAWSITVSGGDCNGFPYTNEFSTQEQNEPFAACQGTAGYRTVWFKFEAPASGNVRISTDYAGGTMGNDTRVALYSVVEVNNYGTFNNIACNDDNGTVVPGRSILYATGLLPGNTYYIQVDGKTASTVSGTFCITVDEMTSAMLATSTGCVACQPLTAFNNSYAGQVSATDVNGKLVALISNLAPGAGTSTYDNAQHINVGPVREDPASFQKYLDRNFTINNASITSANVQFFFLNTELNALIAADPGVTLATLQVTRQTGTVCDNNFIGANGTNSTLLALTGTGTGFSWLEVTTPGFSKYYIHAKKAYAPLKTFLQGAYSSAVTRHKDVNTTWRNILQANALSQPYSVAPFNYSGTENVAATAFTSTSGVHTDIMDWVLVELRSSSSPAIVISRRAAFIREDGRIVDLNGTSPVSFGTGVADGNYHIVIRHRNHMAIRTATASPKVLTSTMGIVAALQDFSLAQVQAFQNVAILTNPAQRDLTGGVFGMWGGNVNSDGAIRATGLASQNDYLGLITALGNNPAAIIPNVYNRADLNMDGTIRASGLASTNDYLFLITTVLGGNVATIILQHQ